jgi:hypothetical protein
MAGPSIGPSGTRSLSSAFLCLFQYLTSFSGLLKISPDEDGPSHHLNLIICATEPNSVSSLQFSLDSSSVDEMRTLILDYDITSRLVDSEEA